MRIARGSSRAVSPVTTLAQQENAMKFGRVVGTGWCQWTNRPKQNAIPSNQLANRLYSADLEAIADGLKPLTMSHTARVISYTATGRARRAPQTDN
jgi:hypothetical protein